MMRQSWVVTLRSWWGRHRETILCLAIACMAVFALEMLGGGFQQLIWKQGRDGAIDLKIFHDLVHRWFAGRPVYSEMEKATYPPASHAIFWPLVGWLAPTPARWLWAGTTVIALGWLTYLIVRESGADTPSERVFVGLMLLSINAIGAVIGNGQIIVHLLPVLLTGLLLLQRDRRGWREDLLAATLLLIALAKPSISVPFFWMVFLIPNRLRPTLLIIFGYLALTLFAVQFQGSGLWTLFGGWLARGSAEAAKHGYGHLNIWLATIGLEEWILPSSLVTLAALGLWTYRHRHRDIWILLGVTALVARLWTYHRLYDDLLILFPMVTLFRIVKRGPSDDGGDVVAGALLAITILTTLAPTRLYYFWPSPWPLLFTSGHVITWIAVLIFLLNQARRETSAKIG